MFGRIVVLSIVLFVFAVLVLNVVYAIDVKYRVYGVGTGSNIHSIYVINNYILGIGIFTNNTIFKAFTFTLDNELNIKNVVTLDECKLPILNTFIENNKVYVTCSNVIYVITVDDNGNVKIVNKITPTYRGCSYVHIPKGTWFRDKELNMYVCFDSKDFSIYWNGGGIQNIIQNYVGKKLGIASIVNLQHFQTIFINNKLFVVYGINYKDVSGSYKANTLVTEFYSDGLYIHQRHYVITNSFTFTHITPFNNTHIILNVYGKGIYLLKIGSGKVLKILFNCKKPYSITYSNYIITTCFEQASNYILITVFDRFGNYVRSIELKLDKTHNIVIDDGFKLSIFRNYLVTSFDIVGNLTKVETVQTSVSISRKSEVIKTFTFISGIVKKLINFQTQLPTTSTSSGFNIVILTLPINKFLQTPKFKIAQAPTKITVQVNKTWQVSTTIENLGYGDYAIVKLFVNSKLCDSKKVYVDANASVNVVLNGCVISKTGNYSGLIQVLDTVGNVHDFKEFTIEAIAPKLVIRLGTWQIVLIIAIIVAVIVLMVVLMKRH